MDLCVVASPPDQKKNDRDLTFDTHTLPLSKKWPQGPLASKSCLPYHSHRIHSVANFLCKQWWRHMTSQLFIKMNSFQEYVKQTVKKERWIQLFAPLNFNFLLMLHLSFFKNNTVEYFHCNNSIFFLDVNKNNNIEDLTVMALLSCNMTMHFLAKEN